MLDRIKSGTIQELAAGKLYALQNTMRLDGRVSSYPASARGYSVANCYLLHAARRRLADRHRLRQGRAGDPRTDRVADPAAAAAVAVPAAAERVHVDQQRRSVRGHFNVEQCYTSNPDAALWFDFGAGSDSGQNTLDRLNDHRGRPRGHASDRQAGPPDRRHQAPIRLIATRWIYDAATKTLFTSDMFTHTSGAIAPDGPWIVQDGDDDPTDFDHVRSFMLNTRYWWLEGVDTAEAARGIDKMFDKYDIETIAPGYGCILRGQKMVAKHMQDARRGSQVAATRAWRCRAMSAATRSGERQWPCVIRARSTVPTAAARDRARRVLDRRLPGAAPQGQDLSRLQRRLPDRRRDRLDAGRDRPSEGLSDHRAAPEQAVARACRR